MNAKTPLSEIMTRNLAVAGLSNNLAQVLEFYGTYKLQHLPVVVGEKLVGIISVNDVIDFIAANAGGNFEDLNAKFSMEKEMTQNPETLNSSATIQDAINLMKSKKFQAVPIEENGRLVGIVTNNDVIKNL